MRRKGAQLTMNDTGLMLNGLVIGRKSGMGEEGSIHTYSKRLFMIGGRELFSLAGKKENDARWGRCWRWRKYSAREDHGMVAEHNYLAGGLDLKRLLDFAGLSEEEKCGRLVFAASNYMAVVDHPLSGRYFFDKNGHKDETPAIIALESMQITAGGTTIASKARKIYPKLFFGQRDREEINQCSFVHGLCRIQPVDLPPAFTLYLGQRLWISLSLADLIVKGCERRIYDGGSGGSHICYGIDLYTLLVSYGIDTDLSQVYAKDAAGKRTQLGPVEKGRYLLTWYSAYETKEAVIENYTDLKLYGDGIILDDFISLHMPPRISSGGPLPVKMPWGTEAEISSASFYCAVEREDQRYYYYFSQEEMRNRYALSEVRYQYDDHQVEKIVNCRGLLLSDMMDSLCDETGKRLALPEDWQIQYMEEDAYHTDTPTYIDRLSDLRGYNRALLAFEKKECFVRPDRYHENEGTFRSLELPSVYRNAMSANEAAVKGVMGVIIRERASTLAPKGYKLILLNEGDDGSVIKEAAVRGALDGMRIGVRPPCLARFEAVDVSGRVLNVGENAAVRFLYREKGFVDVSAQGICRTVYASKLKRYCTVIPESLGEVESLVLSGDALILSDDRDVISRPKRNLFIDKRGIADKTTPFGYGNLVMYRYEGWYLEDFLKQLGITCMECTAVDKAGVKVRLSETGDCFVAFRHSESKGVPYNTAVYKRRTTEYACPRLVSVYDGDTIMKDVTELIVG